MKNFIMLLIIGLITGYIIFAFITKNLITPPAPPAAVNEEYFYPSCGECLQETEYGWTNKCNYTCISEYFVIGNDKSIEFK